jgi:hypothetical protein
MSRFAARSKAVAMTCSGANQRAATLCAITILPFGNAENIL